MMRNQKKKKRKKGKKIKRKEEKEVKQKRIHRLMLEASGNRSEPIICSIIMQIAKQHGIQRKFMVKSRTVAY